MNFGNPDLPISKTVDTLCKNLKRRGGMVQDEAVSIIQHQQKELSQYAAGSEILNHDNHRLMKEIKKLKEENEKSKKWIITEHERAELCKEKVLLLADISKGLQQDVKKLKEENKELFDGTHSKDVGGLDVVDITAENELDDAPQDDF